MARHSWLIGLTVASLLLFGGIIAFWQNRFSAFTEQKVEQQGTGEVTFHAESILGGLKNSWDVVFMSDGTLIFSERGGEVSKLVDGNKVVITAIDDVRSRGEGGLTGIALDSDFSSNNYLYTCYNSTAGDVRVVRWKLDTEASELSDKTAIVTGIPSNSSGRHSGCRVKSAGDGALWVGTGDAAQSSHPQDLNSLGGKILRVTRDGRPVEGNIETGDRRIFNYGHRNIQGIALFDEPIDGVYGYSIEHGSSVDDEVNLITSGNFGWDPLPPYDESVPMTNKNKFPDAIDAIWSSGNSTIAPSGGEIIRGDEWGRYKGSLAMAVLKDQHLRLLTFDSGNDFRLESEEVFFERDFGRLRSVSMGPNGGLHLTTDNGRDDNIIRVVPR